MGMRGLKKAWKMSWIKILKNNLNVLTLLTIWKIKSLVNEEKKGYAIGSNVRTRTLADMKYCV